MDSATSGPFGAIVTGDALREYADRMAEAERIARFGVWSWRLDTNQVLWSQELHHIYGLEPGTFGGTLEAFASFLHPEDRDRVLAHVRSAVETGEQFVFEERIVRTDGQVRVLLSQGRPIRGPEGEVAGLVGVCHDVTEQVEARRELGLSEQRVRAIVDNVPSMVAVKDLNGRYVMSNAETGRVLGVSADELIGHECREFFPTVAEQLIANDRRAIAEMDPVYDEAVLIQDGEPRTYLTVTFALPDNEGRPAEVCTIATDVTERREREDERRERSDWRRRISGALSEGRMLAYAQPVVDLRSGRPVACELLVRMREAGEGRGVLLPDAFLPQAERFGAIQAIDVWMTRQAIELDVPLRREVNLSAISLGDPAVRNEIVELLSARPEQARMIAFEITETADPEHLDAACEFAAALDALGCGLALDDFGTGFGSFTYLHRLPLRYLKIDISFVRRLVDSEEDQRVVRTILSIAREFDLRVIAEGVENQPTLELLRELGAHYAQGFHLGRPAPFPAPGTAGGS